MVERRDTTGMLIFLILNKNECLLLRLFFLPDKKRMDFGRIGGRRTVATFPDSHLHDCLPVVVGRAVDRSKSRTAFQDELAAHAARIVRASRNI